MRFCFQKCLTRTAFLFTHFQFLLSLFIPFKRSDPINYALLAISSNSTALLPGLSKLGPGAFALNLHLQAQPSLPSLLGILKSRAFFKEDSKTSTSRLLPHLLSKLLHRLRIPGPPAGVERARGPSRYCRGCQ